MNEKEPMSQPIDPQPSTRVSGRPTGLGPLTSAAFLIGGLGALALVAGYLTQPEQFFRSYLVSFFLVLAIALGSLALAMVHHLSSGAWGLIVRRILEAASRTLPFVLLLFLPLLLGLGELYSWAQPEKVAVDEHLQHRTPWLNEPFFIARAAIYFGAWLVFAALLNRWSLQQDLTGDPSYRNRMRALSGAGLLAYGLTATFASFDWQMSLDHHLHSSLHGMMFIVDQGLATLAFLVPVAVYLAQREPLSRVFQPSHFHDYGKLMLAFVMLWAYLNVSQFLIIWSGNLPEEILYYQDRMDTPWKWVSLGMVLFHFLLPFLLLLSRDLKRNAARLTAVALLLLAMRWVDYHWFVAPIFHPEGISFHWLDLAALAGLGGLWFGIFLGQLEKRDLIPTRDPELKDVLSHG